MKVADVAHVLLEKLGPLFAFHGFHFKKTEYAFERKYNGAIDKYYFLVHPQGNSVYHLEPCWSVKRKEILQLYHLVARKEKKYFKYSTVLDNSLANLIEFADTGNESASGKIMKYVFQPERDIDNVCGMIFDHFQKYLLPYFDRYYSVAHADQLLNKNPSELSVHSWLYPYRACIGLIAAKLNDNPNYEDLLKVYTYEINTSGVLQNFQDEYNDLVALLSVR